MENVRERPLFAMVGKDGQIELHIFGRIVKIQHTGPDVEVAAVVGWWNDHFDREWMGVRETTATIMQNFTEALQYHGVDDATIRVAIDAMCSHAGT